MSAKTKIVVLHLKELIYTGIFVVLGILFIVLLFIMFRSGDDKEVPKSDSQSGEESPSPSYEPGTYTSALYIDDNLIEITAELEENRIVSLTMSEMSDEMSSLYPLFEPSFETLAQQICENQSLDELTYSEDATYTSELLLEVIEGTLAQAKPTPSPEDEAGR